VARITPDGTARCAADPVALLAVAPARRLVCAALSFGVAALLSACGSGSGDAAADGSPATAASVAQQTVGADLLPPDAAIAGTSAVGTDLPDEDLAPANASSASAADLLPPA